MAPSDNKEHPTDLETLARARFTNLTEAELRLLRLAPTGKIAGCGQSMNIDDLDNDPSKADAWSMDREVSADLLRWLCADRIAREFVDPKGIQVMGAKITGVLDLSYLTIPFRLALWNCRLTNGVELLSTEIPELALRGSWLRSLVADRLAVSGTVFLSDGFHADGQVRLLGARIGGNLDCGNATFKNPSQPGEPGSGKALNADRVSVNGAVLLNGKFRAEGEVSLPDARIGGDLDCANGTFFNSPQKGTNAGGPALGFDRAVVNGSVFLRNGFSAEGEVRFVGAQIGNSLDCFSGTFRNPAQPEISSSGRALNAHRVVVKGDVYLRECFCAEGEVLLRGAQVGGSLECNRATFSGALHADTAVINGTLKWAEIANPTGVEVDLTNASVGALVDVAQSWPAGGNLSVDGFVYGRIFSDKKDAKTRLEWLARQRTFTPQPYRQLAKVMREEGDGWGARRVLSKMENLRRAQENTERNRFFRFWGSIWNAILRWAIGYGYHPGRSLWFLLGLVALGLTLFGSGYAAGSIAPTEKEAYSTFKQASQLPPHCDGFNPFIYSLENSFPLIKLGQIDHWQPDPDKHWQLHPRDWVPRSLYWLFSPWSLRWFRWIQICLGWFFATMGIAAVTGIVRKD
jgi:hypothetical protein